MLEKNTTPLPKKTEWQPLSTHAIILRAPLFKTEHGQEQETFRIISIKDFPPAGYLSPPSRTAHLAQNINRARKYTVKPYDVLITIVGTIGEVTMVPPDCDDNWVPATNMFVIRFSDDVSRKACTFYGLMKSAFGVSVFESLAHGNGIQIVSKKQFSRISIPPFTEDLVKWFDDLWHQEADLYERSRGYLKATRQVYKDLPEISTIVA